MLSKQSNAFFSKKGQFEYKKFKRNKSLSKFIKLVCKGLVPRPHYALGLLFAADQAKYFGYKKFSVIEFGCWNNDGLLDLDHWCKEISDIMNIDYEIYGFDSGSGLPISKNKYDVKYKWSNSDYSFKRGYDITKNNKINLIIGDVNKTIKNLKNYLKKNSPIGFVSFDMDYYTSTYNSFKLFKIRSDFFIPRPILYFDDFVLTSEFEGEYLAINNFNKRNKCKISNIGELPEQLSMKWNKWIFLAKRYKVFTNFNHKLYSKKYENNIYKEIIKS